MKHRDQVGPGKAGAGRRTADRRRLPAAAPEPAGTSALKAALHPRNRYRAGYDFPALLRRSPDLARFVRTNPSGAPTIDFADPAAVLALNRALLRQDYGIGEWELPAGYLCPPIPGRADYVHHLADLLAAPGIPRGPAVAILDVGVGANCVYPIIGVHDYGWRFVGTENDPVALASARANVAAHPALASHVEIRHQPAATAIFRGVTAAGETFAAAMCNPPFHRSAAEAAAGTRRKLRNLHGRSGAGGVLNFGGRGHELWCAGGEAGFVQRMITESAQRPGLCRWFTTLVSKRDSLPIIDRALRAVQAHDVRTIELATGQKKARIVAWRFRAA